VEVYGISKDHSISDSIQLAEVDRGELLSSVLHSNSSLLTNSIGHITYDGVSILSAGQRQLGYANSKYVNTAFAASQQQILQRSNSSKTTAKEVAQASAPSAKAISFFEKAGQQKNAKKSEDTSASNDDKLTFSKSFPPSKQPIQSTSLSSTKTSTEVDSKKSNKSSENNVSAKVGSEMDVDEGEWDEDCGSDGKKYVIDKSNLQKRKMVDSKTTSNNDVDMWAEDVGDVEADAITTSKKQGGKGRSTAHIHGAMDDFIEDIKIAEYNASKNKDTSGEVESGENTRKIKKKKLVEKVSQHNL
jgi:hypothetical protein